jgi:dimethylargininase
MQLAITRQVSRSIQECELTFLSREPIDVSRAREQHAQYEQALRQVGMAILSLPEEPDLPDSVFVEDTALVLDECALVLRPGAPSRRREVELIHDILRHFRPLHRVQAPAHVDGGDILRLGRRIYIGLSQRTDRSAYEQIRSWVEPMDYTVHTATVRDCLHLKSAVTEIAPDFVLLNPKWIDPASLSNVSIIEVDPSEPQAANVLCLGDTVVMPEVFPRTRARLEQAGMRVRCVEADELAKAEGALTCCSLILTV